MNLKYLKFLFLTTIFIFSGCGTDKAVKEIMDNISEIGDVSLDDEELIKEIGNAYADLNDRQKKQVENYDELLDAKESFQELMDIQAVMDDISEIGDVSLDDEKLIKEIENAYADLDDKQKKQVENYDEYLNAKTILEQLQERLLTAPYKDVLEVCHAIYKILEYPETFQIHRIDYIDGGCDYYWIEYSCMDSFGDTVTLILDAMYQDNDFKTIHDEIMPREEAFAMLTSDGDKVENLDVSFVEENFTSVECSKDLLIELAFLEKEGTRFASY